MEELFNQIAIYIGSMGVFGMIINSFIIIIESMLPILPLVVFITLNFVAFGNFWGFILSWISTILGCILSYSIFRYGFGSKFYYLIKNKDKINKYSNVIKNMSLVKLTVLIAIPFTPAFVVNIVAGLLKVDFKKYIVALLIGKISLIYFWAYIGTSFIDSFRDPMIVLKIIILVLIVYVISKLINKLFKI